MNYSVTQNGKPLDPSKYNWDENTKTFSTKENNLVLDFLCILNCTFKTGFNCTFNTGSGCTFNTGLNCTFNTDSDCTFNTGSGCTFNTDYNCTFNTGSGCTFNTGFNCTFNTGDNCVAIRRDVKGITEIPKNKTIKFNRYDVTGYTFVEEPKPETCEGKIVEIEGKKYKLVLA